MIVGNRDNKNKIKVLHIITGFATGGAERMLVKLVNNSKEIDHRIISLRGAMFGTQEKNLSDKSINVDYLDINSPFHLFTRGYTIRNIFKEFNPDIVHGWLYHGILASIIFTKNKPIIAGIRNSLHDIKKQKHFTRLAIYFISKFNKKLHTILYNSLNGALHHEKIGFFKEKRHIIYNGFNTEEFTPSYSLRNKIRSQYDIDDQQFVVGNVARYSPMKDHYTLIKGFADYNKRNKKSTLVLVGKGIDNDNDHLMKAIDENISRKNVLLLGERNDISDILNMFDVFCLSSAWGEGFPNVIGEAMSMEIPCVSTDVGDASAIIDEFGFVVEPKSPRQIKEALLKLSDLINNTNNEFQALKKNARKRVLHNFDINKITNEYEDLYSRVLK